MRHRVLAYWPAAARIRSATTSVAEMAISGRAVDLLDIGATLQAKIVELVETGDIAALAKLRDRVPAGLAEVARLDGIGPKRATALWKELERSTTWRPRSPRAGYATCLGFGATTEARLAAELARLAAEEATADERVPIGQALPVAEEIARDSPRSRPRRESRWSACGAVARACTTSTWSLRASAPRTCRTRWPRTRPSSVSRRAATRAPGGDARRRAPRAGGRPA